MQNREALVEVMNYFNKDNVTVPGELYKAVFDSLTESDFNDKKMANCEPPISQLGGVLSSELNSTRKYLRENFDTLRAIKDKLQGLGYFDETSILKESFAEYEKAIKSFEGREGSLSGLIQHVHALSKIERDITFNLLEHINFLF